MISKIIVLNHTCSLFSKLKFGNSFFTRVVHFIKLRWWLRTRYPCKVLERDQFLPDQMLHFFLQIFVESVQKVCLIFAIDCSCRFKVIHIYCVSCILNNCYHDRVKWEIHFGFICRRNLLFRLILRLWCIVVESCFDYGYETAQKPLWFVVE